MALSKIPTDLVSGTLASSQLPAGSVLQVVSTTYSTQVSTTSTSWVDTPHTASITPSSSSSKIMVLMSASAYTDTGGPQLYITVFRGNASSGTNLGNSVAGFGSSYPQNMKCNVSCAYLDTPATTSSVTYTIAMQLAAAGVGYLDVNGDMSTLTLLEIAA